MKGGTSRATRRADAVLTALEGLDSGMLNRLRTYAWRLLVLAPCALVACGGESKDHPGAGASGKGATAGSGGGGVGGGGVGGAGVGGAGGSGGLGCPATPPSDGDPCPVQSTGDVAADCTFGDDLRPSCRTAALCVQGEWRLTMPDAKCSEPPLPSACGTAPPTVGDACSDSTLECWYDSGTHCACSPCKGGSPYPVCQVIDPPEWACGTPDEDCPNPLPQAGEACDTPTLQCGPSCEEPIRCESGRWVYGQAMCPQCASPDTPIATPKGERAIAELVPGDLVYSVDGGAIVAVPLLRVGSTPVNAHRVMRIELDDGRVLELSPRHPTADGRHFYDLRAGTPLDDRHVVVESELVPYRFERTYDILPASSTGTYFAAGALIGSTLAPTAAPVAP